MKKILFLFALLLFTDAVGARQTSDGTLHTLFSDFRHCKHAEYLRISKPLMALMKAFMKNGEHEDCNIAKMITSMKVLELEECSPEVKAAFLERVRTIKSKGYNEIVRENKINGVSVIMVKIKKELIREIVILDADKKDGTIVRIKGKVPLKALQSVIDSQRKKKK